MTPELWFLLGIVVFWILLYTVNRIFHLEKHGLEVHTAYFMYKSDWMKNFLDRISKRRQIFWKTLANIGIALAFGMMVFSIYFLANNLVRFVIPVGGASPVVPILPGITIPLYWLPYFFAAATVIGLTHEFAHGIAARVEKVPVKSVRIGAALMFLAGFVEPDENKFEKASKSSKLRIIAAGSSTNFVTYLLVILLLVGLFTSSSSGILIHETREPSTSAGLQQWDVVYALNSTPITTVDDFKQYMIAHNISHGQNLNFSTNRGNIIITAGTNPTSGNVSFGISYSNYYPLRILEISPIVTINLYMFLNWLSLISGSVAIFNMLPLYPFDGDKFLYYSLENVVKKRLHKVRIFYNIVCLGLIALNIALTLINYGLIPI